MMEDMSFANASKLNGELTINFYYEEGVPLQFSIVIKEGFIKSIKIGSGMYKITIDFEFGSEVLEDIPARPTNVEWYEYQPQIEIGFIETEYKVGDSIDLEDAYIEYLEDIEAVFTNYFDITEDMISGFTTETAGTRTMTITFYGLTIDVEYTVTESAVE